jgi:LysR family transcriptional regulator, transcriptional activator of the cysJI operon
MTLRHLSIFTVVSDTLSMTKAAQKLFIAQPSVSQSIAELERDLGVRLFERLNGKLFLTVNGQQFLPYARHVSSLMSEVSDIFSGSNAREKLRAASTLTVGTTVFNRIIRSFKEKNPSCDIYFRTENTRIVENLILSDKIDIALIEGNVKSPHILTIPVMDDELVVIMHPGNPLLRIKNIKAKDLLEQQFILREEGSGTRELFENVMRRKSITYSIAGEMNNAEAIKLAVAAGLGISVISRRSIEKELQRKELCAVEIPDLRFSRKFSIIYHKNKFVTSFMRNFIDIAKSCR